MSTDIIGHPLPSDLGLNNTKPLQAASERIYWHFHVPEILMNSDYCKMYNGGVNMLVAELWKVMHSTRSAGEDSSDCDELCIDRGEDSPEHLEKEIISFIYRARTAGMKASTGNNLPSLFEQ